MSTTDETKALKLRMPDESPDADPLHVPPETKKRVRHAGSLTALILNTNPIVNRDALRRTIWRLERESGSYRLGFLVATGLAFFLVGVQLVEGLQPGLCPLPPEWVPYGGAVAFLLMAIAVPLAIQEANRRILVKVITELLEREGLASTPLPDVRHDPTTEL